MGLFEFVWDVKVISSAKKVAVETKKVRANRCREANVAYSAKKVAAEISL